MDPNNETNDGQIELSAETAKLAAIGRGEELPAGDEGKTGEDGQQTADDDGAKPERPDHVPEKFWDAEKGEVNLENLLKSYTELEKSRGKKADEGDEGEDGKGGEDDKGKDEKGSEEDAVKFTPEAVNDAVALASTEVAEGGKLTDETNQKFLDMGFSQQYIDTQVAAVKALSAALTAQVYETAGGEEDYKAALQWAGKNWSASQVEKFDNGIDDADLREPLIKGLMADYRAANPGEGKQTLGGGGGGDSDVYTSHDEFQQDLAKADAANDQVARKKAVEKLARSRKSKSLKTQTSRPGLSRFDR